MVSTMLSTSTGGACGCVCGGDPCCTLPAGVDLCGCCGYIVSWSVHVTYEGNWVIIGAGNVEDNSSGDPEDSCGCSDFTQPSGSGDTPGVEFPIFGYYWNWRPDLCCVQLLDGDTFEPLSWSANATVESCDKEEDPDDDVPKGQLKWDIGGIFDGMVPFGSGFVTWEIPVDTGKGSYACCNCGWLFDGGSQVSVFGTGFSHPSWEYAIGDVGGVDGTCNISACIWNRHPVKEQQDYDFEYTSVIATVCCTNEPTGTATGRVIQLPVWGVDGYVMKGYIDVLGQDLDGFVINAAGGRDLFFRFEEDDNNNANFLGRIDVVIEGEDCDGNLTQTDSWVAASYFEADGDVDECANCVTDRIAAGGLGQWTPDLSSNYKRFKITMTAYGWDTVSFCGNIVDPETEPTKAPEMETTEIWCDIDAAFWTCP